MKRNDTLLNSDYAYLIGICVWVIIVMSRSFSIWFDWETVRFFVQPRPGQYRWFSPWWSGWINLSDYDITAASLTLRPLMTWIFQVEALLFKAWAPGYHILSLAAHLACCCLLFLLLRKLRITPIISSLFALLFAVHPLTTTPLWILVDLAEVFVLLGGLIALLAYPSRPIGVLCGLFIALYSKESAVSIPAWLIAYDVIFLDSKKPFLTTFKKRVRRLAPSIALTGLYLVHRTTLFSGLGGYRSLDHGQLNQFWDVFSQNIAWLFTLPHANTTVTWLFIVITIVSLLWTRSRITLFATLWLILFLIPTINLCNKWYLYTSVATLMTLFAGVANRGYTNAKPVKAIAVSALLVAVYFSVVSYAELHHQKRNADLPIRLATILKKNVPSLPTGSRIYFILPPTLNKQELKGHYFDPRSFQVKADKSPIESIVWDLNSTRYKQDMTPIWTRSVEAAVRLKYNDISLEVILIDHDELRDDDAVQVLYDPPFGLNVNVGRL